MSSKFYPDFIPIYGYMVSSFSPPWLPARSLPSGLKALRAESGLGECNMTDSYCSLQEIPIMSYLPDSYKVRSGPGVSAPPPAGKTDDLIDKET